MKIGIIGVGAMGAGMATNLLARGYDVHVRDVIAEREQALAKRGAHCQPTPASLILAVDVTIIVVETAAQVQAVLSGDDGLLAALSNAGNSSTPKAVMLCPTIAPDDTVRFANEITQAGARVIDAPISGGPERAADGSMSIMLAAPQATLSELEPLLADLSSKRFIVSAKPGDGARAKLANNLAGGAYLAAASEAMSLAVNMGLDPQLMLSLMAASSGQSWVGDDRLPRGVQGLMPTAGAATRVLRKDLTLAVEAAKQSGSPVPMASAALERFSTACDQGMGENDDSSLFTLYQQQSSR